MKSDFQHVRLVKCATLGTNFVDIFDGARPIAIQVGRPEAEAWLKDLLDGGRAAEDAFVRVYNITALPLAAAGHVVRDYSLSRKEVPADNATGVEQEGFVLPVVAGRRIRGSNADFERACMVHIERLQHGIGDYDSAMVDTLCEAVRLSREYSDRMQVRG